MSIDFFKLKIHNSCDIYKDSFNFITKININNKSSDSINNNNSKKKHCKNFINNRLDSEDKNNKSNNMLSPYTKKRNSKTIMEDSFFKELYQINYKNSNNLINNKSTHKIKTFTNKLSKIDGLLNKINFQN